MRASIAQYISIMLLLLLFYCYIIIIKLKNIINTLTLRRVRRQLILQSQGYSFAYKHIINIQARNPFSIQNNLQPTFTIITLI